MILRVLDEVTGRDEVTACAVAARRGDRDALERFIAATQRDVWRFVAHLDSPASADDLTQETYLRALRSLPGFAGRSAARTWLLAIARRVVIDHIRQAKVRPRTTAVDDWRGVVEENQSAVSVPGFDEGIALADLLSRLDPQRREAFVLTQITRLPYREAAEVCGCPVGTIRSRVARARDDLIRLLSISEDATPDRTAG
jgi:RNA polymerase sigma-70 factor (ECF subfamily)